MTQFTTWIQNNWYSLGTLLVQFGFLAAAVWFARKILTTVRASQEQFGALLKMSLTGALGDRSSSAAPAERSFAAASPYWLTPEEKPVLDLPQPQEIGPSRWAAARQRIAAWMQAPMSTSDTSVWRKTVRWLQTPAGS
jgi:hypothetical protein